MRLVMAKGRSDRIAAQIRALRAEGMSRGEAVAAALRAEEALAKADPQPQGGSTGRKQVHSYTRGGKVVKAYEAGFKPAGPKVPKPPRAPAAPKPQPGRRPKAQAKPEESAKPKAEEPKAAPKEKAPQAAPTSPEAILQGLITDEEAARPKQVQQKGSTKEEVYGAAKEAMGAQAKFLNEGTGLDKDIGATVLRGDQNYDWSQLTEDLSKPGPVILIGPLKGEERATEKVEADYEGDWSKLTDLVRATVAVDSVHDLPNVMDALRKRGLKIAKSPKNRFAKPTSAGYRDLMMNIEFPDGHIGELQVHTKPILKVKEKAHKLYEVVRSLEAKAQKEGRTGKYTPEEREAIEKANAESARLYGEAWAQSTRSQEQTLAKGETEPQEVEHYDLDGQHFVLHKGHMPMRITDDGQTKPYYQWARFYHDATKTTPGELRKAAQLSMFGPPTMGSKRPVQVRQHVRLTKEGKVADVQAHVQQRKAAVQPTKDPRAAAEWAVQDLEEKLEHETVRDSQEKRDRLIRLAEKHLAEMGDRFLFLQSRLRNAIRKLKAMGRETVTERPTAPAEAQPELTAKDVFKMPGPALKEVAGAGGPNAAVAQREIDRRAAKRAKAGKAPVRERKAEKAPTGPSVDQATDLYARFLAAEEHSLKYQPGQRGYDAAARKLTAATKAWDSVPSATQVKARTAYSNLETEALARGEAIPPTVPTAKPKRAVVKAKKVTPVDVEPKYNADGSLKVTDTFGWSPKGPHAAFKRVVAAALPEATNVRFRGSRGTGYGWSHYDLEMPDREGAQRAAEFMRSLGFTGNAGPSGNKASGLGERYHMKIPAEYEDVALRRVHHTSAPKPAVSPRASEWSAHEHSQSLDQPLSATKAAKLAVQARTKGEKLEAKGRERDYYGNENTHKRLREGESRRRGAQADITWGLRLQKLADAIEGGAYQPTPWDDALVKNPSAAASVVRRARYVDEYTGKAKPIPSTPGVLSEVPHSWDSPREGQEAAAKTWNAQVRKVAAVLNRWGDKTEGGRFRMHPHPEAIKQLAAAIKPLQALKKEHDHQAPSMQGIDSDPKDLRADLAIGWTSPMQHSDVLRRWDRFHAATEPGAITTSKRWTTPDRSRTSTSTDRHAYAAELESSRFKDPGHKNIAGFFPTPYTEVAHAVDKLDVQPGMTVLEPSAGTGSMADLLPDHAQVTTAEQSPKLREVLQEKGYTPAGSMEQVAGKFDRVLMNPPFENGQDMKHVQHAFGRNLKPGGRLVAIVSNGAMHNTSARHQAFQEWVAEHQAEAHRQIDPSAWKRSGTAVGATMITLEKPMGGPERNPGKMNPYYEDYAHAQGRSPAEQLAHDKARGPSMAPFMEWNSKRSQLRKALQKAQKDYDRASSARMRTLETGSRAQKRKAHDRAADRMERLQAAKDALRTHTNTHNTPAPSSLTKARISFAGLRRLLRGRR